MILRKINSYVKYLFCDIKRSFFNIFSDYKYFQSSFFLLILLFLIVYYPIIRANFDYKDDVLRNVGEGQLLWSKCWGAHIGQLLGFILSGGFDLFDYSPLGHIVASIFLSLSGIILIRVFSSKKNFDIFNIILVLVIGTNPCFIECLSYKYDAPIFSMSIFFSIAPLVFYKEKSYLYIFFSIVFLLCSFMSYHASSGVYIVSIVFLVLYLYLKGSDIKLIFRLILKSMFAYFIAGLIFYYTLNTIEFSKTALENIQTKFTINSIFMNLFSKYYYILRTWNIFYKVVFLLMIILFVVSICCNSKRNRLITFFVIFVALIIVFIFQLGISNILLDREAVERYLYGYGITITIIGLMCYEFIIKNKKLLIICLTFVFLCVNSVLKYGNCLYNVKQESFGRVFVVINDLNKIKFNNHKLKLGIVDTYIFYNFNIGDKNDPCLYVIAPIFSNTETRMINYYFPKSKVETNHINMDKNYSISVYQENDNMQLLKEGWQNKIEIDERNNIQFTIKN